MTTNKTYSQQEISEMVDLYKDKLNVEQINSLTVAANALAQGEIQADKTQIDVAFSALQQGNFSLVVNLFEKENERLNEEAKKLAEIQRNIGKLAFNNDTEKALKAYRRATQLDPDNADGWNRLAALLFRIGELDEAIGAFQIVLRLGQKHQDQEEMAWAYGNLGILYKTRGDLDKTIDYFNKTLEIHENLGHKEGMANQYGNLGNVYATRGDLDKAVDYYNKALKIEESLGRKEGMAAGYGNLGTVYQTRGDLDKAVEYYNKALQIDESLGLKEGMASDYGNLGNVYLTRGDLDKAVEYYNKALKINESLGRKEGMANQYGNLGIVYLTRGDLDKAVEYYNKALKINEDLGRKEGIAIQYQNLGIVYQMRGDLDKARIYWEKSLSLYQAIGSPEAKRIQSFLDELKPNRLKVNHLGPIQSAEIEFGDLTVLVGPQGTGKSIFLQTLKLLIDREQIHDTFKRHNVGFGEDVVAFFNGYYGRGMSGIWGKDSKIEWNETDIQLPEYAKATSAETRHEKLFYIPAQRVMSLPSGVSQNFGQFNYGDPYNLRAFSDAVHDLIQNEFGAKGVLFPGTDLLNESLKAPIAKHLFAGNELVIDEHDFTKRLALKIEGQEQALGFLSWSAGQREFAPLLMGIYWLCTEEKLQRRVTGDGKKYETIEWVVIEEPEMGLHPQGITTVLLLVLELLRRGYKVVLSTHSSVVLEMVWALQEFKQLSKADESDVRKIFELPPSSELGKIALERAMKVFYFERNGNVHDISKLDPSADMREAEWGGISGFASRVHEAIASAVVRSEE